MKLLNILKKESFTVLESISLIIIFLIFLSVFSLFSSYGVLGNFVFLVGTLIGNFLFTGMLSGCLCFLFFYLKERKQLSFDKYNLEVFSSILILCAFVDLGLSHYYLGKLGGAEISQFSRMEQWFVPPIAYTFFFFNLAKRNSYPEVK